MLSEPTKFTQAQKPLSRSIGHHREAEYGSKTFLFHNLDPSQLLLGCSEGYTESHASHTGSQSIGLCHYISLIILPTNTLV